MINDSVGSNAVEPILTDLEKDIDHKNDLCLLYIFKTEKCVLDIHLS